MTNSNQNKFEELKPRYKYAYYKANRKTIYNVWYSMGWVYLEAQEDGSINKFRIKQFEEMTITLEKRTTIC